MLYIMSKSSKSTNSIPDFMAKKMNFNQFVDIENIFHAGAPAY